MDLRLFLWPWHWLSVSVSLGTQIFRFSCKVLMDSWRNQRVWHAMSRSYLETLLCTYKSTSGAFGKAIRCPDRICDSKPYKNDSQSITIRDPNAERRLTLPTHARGTFKTLKDVTRPPKIVEVPEGNQENNVSEPSEQKKEEADFQDSSRNWWEITLKEEKLL